MGFRSLLEGLKTLLRNRVVQAVLVLPLAALLLYFAFRGIDLASVWSALMQANWWWVGLAMCVGFVAHILRAARWNLLLEALGKPMQLGETFYAVMVGYFVNLLLPRAGEVARCAQLSRSQGVKFDSTLGTVIVERFFDVLAFFLLTVIAVLVSVRIFGSFLWEQVLYPSFSSLSSQDFLLIVLILLLAVVAGILFVWAVRRELLGHKLRVRLGGIRRGLLDGMRTVFSMRRKRLFYFYTVLLWGCYWMMAHLICLSLPFTSHLWFDKSLILTVVGSFGMLIPVQGGIGSFHLATMLWLEVEGLTRVDGLAYATLSHGAQTALLILIPALLFLFRSLRPRESRRERKTLADG